MHRPPCCELLGSCLEPPVGLGWSLSQRPSQAHPEKCHPFTHSQPVTPLTQTPLLGARGSDLELEDLTMWSLASFLPFMSLSLPIHTVGMGMLCELKAQSWHSLLLCWVVSISLLSITGYQRKALKGTTGHLRMVLPCVSALPYSSSWAS
jgi:hypothetical protein